MEALSFGLYIYTYMRNYILTANLVNISAHYQLINNELLITCYEKIQKNIV